MSTEYGVLLPRMEDLPSEYEGEDALPDEFHTFLGVLLMQTFRPPKFQPDRYFSALDMYLYYQAQPVVHGLRPDWFGVVGVPLLHRGGQRTSFATWNEAAGPLIIVEALSPGTAKGDLGRGAIPKDATTKWNVYEKVLKVPYYVTIDHHKTEVHFFRHDGEGFVEVTQAENRLWMPEADLGIGLWHGTFDKLTGDWVRFYDAEGNWIPTVEEREQRERQEKERERAEKDRERTEKERERAEKERLAAMLRALGIDPDAR